MSDTTFDARPARIVHPLDDEPEQKLYREDLGRMRITPGARAALLMLRLYLLAMVLMVAWRAAGMAGLV
jgi:hypothetical protein